jgi:acyl-CoA thioesterase
LSLLTTHPLPAHPFDSAIALSPLAPGQYAGHTSPAYANMVGPFGGIVAAQMLHAIMQHPLRLGEPVAFTINYAAALADGAFEIEAQPARTNRSTQHWQVQVRQAGQVALTATAITAVRRETWSDVEHAMPLVPAASTLAREFPPVPMTWVKRYDIRPVAGQLSRVWDGSGQADSLSRLWLRDEPARPLDFCSLAALADVFFIRLFLRRATRVPVGTVTMTVFFHTDSAQLAEVGDNFLLGQAVGQNFRNGYFDQAAQLWATNGELLVTTSQLVYYRE